MRSVTLNGSKFFLFEKKTKINFSVCSYSQPIASMSESETEKTGDESETAEMLRIWLPLLEVGELSQTGEFRNIDKRKTNVKTELMIEGVGGV